MQREEKSGDEEEDGVIKTLVEGPRRALVSTISRYIIRRRQGANIGGRRDRKENECHDERSSHDTYRADSF